jgi:hypothetical protein
MDDTREASAASVGDGLPDSEEFRLMLNGQPVRAIGLSFGGAFALLVRRGPASIEIAAAFDAQRVVVRPLRHGLEAARIGDRRFRIDLPDLPLHLSIEFDGHLRRCLLLAVETPLELPAPAGDVRVFAPGTVHDVGELQLQSGQTLVIPRGAVVRGRIVAQGAENIRIMGDGIIDGSCYDPAGEHRPRLMLLEGCRNVLVQGVTMVNGPSWNLVPTGCDGVTVDKVKIFNGNNSGDGIDLVGCRNVTVRDCFVRTKDDCIAIKAAGRSPVGWQNVEQVHVSGCTFWNAEWGNAIEIGYETRCDVMRDIVFRDIDVIRCEREGYTSGGVLTIHNGDRAVIENVLYEDIRIEDAREKLVDFKITLDRYSRDEQRGQIRNITLRNVRVVDGAFPPSIIQGYSADHIIDTIRFENVRDRDRTIDGILDARLVTERCRNISFAGRA